MIVTLLEYLLKFIVDVHFLSFLISSEQPIKRCTGGTILEVECCNTKTPCSVGEGGCNVDDDCESDLICGYRNCDPKIFSRWTNCCSGRFTIICK